MPYNYLGYMWLEQDMKIEEAGQLIIMANDLRPDSGAYVDSLGWYYFKKGDYDSAVETLLRAVKIMEEQDPPEEDAVVYDHVAQAYFMQGNIPEAINYVRKATKLEPENEEFAERLKEYLAAKTASPKNDAEKPQPVAAPEAPGKKATKLPNAA